MRAAARVLLDSWPAKTVVNLIAKPFRFRPASHVFIFYIMLALELFRLT